MPVFKCPVLGTDRCDREMYTDMQSMLGREITWYLGNPQREVRRFDRPDDRFGTTLMKKAFDWKSP